ncbi:Haloacid dehalogenase domain protein hydrolase [mine drainage metagenome]|uniref:Haloacid dehalogenase domain protein hydrolase n=1 Tax=mine drainage metagenome TaxID=410659 RepID=T0Z9K4_9ZZZZ
MFLLNTVNSALKHSIPFPGEDGWNMLSNLSSEYSNEDLFTEAFHQTRKEMLVRLDMTFMPDSVKDLLEKIKPISVLALASNSPPEYVEPVVRRYSLDRYFNYIKPKAGKPMGFTQIVDRIVQGEELDDEYSVLSVGDHYPNDILPAVESGWDGAFVNPFRLEARKSTISDESIEALSPWIIEWVRK